MIQATLLFADRNFIPGFSIKDDSNFFLTFASASLCFGVGNEVLDIEEPEDAKIFLSPRSRGYRNESEAKPKASLLDNCSCCFPRARADSSE